MGSSFCESTLQFLTICMTRHLRGGRESSHIGLKGDVICLGFCYLNSHCIMKSVILMFMSYSSYEYSRISSKSQ